MAADSELGSRIVDEFGHSLVTVGLENRASAATYGRGAAESQQPSTGPTVGPAPPCRLPSA